MYHPEIVDQSIKAALEARLIEKPPDRHTISEVEQFVEHMEALYVRDENGNSLHEFGRPLEAWEIAWIDNERFLCRVDFDYFVTHYGFISNEANKAVRFIPWLAQMIFLAVCAEMELLGIAIMIICLKARQEGITTLVDLMVLHRVIFYEGVSALTASSNPQKTRKILEKMEFCYWRLPEWLRPEMTRRNMDDISGVIEFGNLESSVDLEHGAKRTGIARGTTPTVSHCTELAEYLNAEVIVDASLMRAVHYTPRTFLVLEGTGQGQDNWWHKTWESAKEGYPQGRAKLRPMFLPWYVGRDLYPNEGWLRAHPIPEGYDPPEEIKLHAEAARQYVLSNDILARYLGAEWRMPVQQMWFYDVEKSEAVRKGQLSTFLQEMPADDFEAFQNTAKSVFEVETLAAHRLAQRQPLGVYGLLGPAHLIPPFAQLQAAKVDHTKPTINITANWNGLEPYRFTLVPLRWDGYATDGGLDKVYIWEMPEPGEIYGVGVDTARGLNLDRSSIEIIRKGTPWSRPRQCAEFTSGRLNALDIFPWVLALATLYSVADEMGDRHQCRLAIECRDTGDQTQILARFAGWTNLHRWQRIDNRSMDQSQFTKFGIYTTGWFRQATTEFLFKMLRDLELEIYSPWFIKEMQSLVVDNMGKMIAGGKAHDDRYMSLGFSVISLYQFERDRAVAVPKPPPGPKTARRYATWTPSAQQRPVDEDPAAPYYNRR